MGKSRVTAFPSVFPGLGPQWEGKVATFTSQERAVTCNSSQDSEALFKPRCLSGSAPLWKALCAPDPSLSHIPPVG